MLRTVRSVGLVVLAVSGLGCLMSACASASGGVPIEQYNEEPDPTGGEYVIAAGDVLSIQVWEQPQMSGRMRVRADGRITIPLINEVVAAGKTPSKLSADLEASLKSVVLNPKVSVGVEESRPLTISVLGEVVKPGTQPFERDSGVAQALAAAGGLNNFAHKDRIFVVRTTPKPVRIHFTYEALTQNVGGASTFKLRPGDVIIVE
jgi:polysaccharide biosynthesis/export protein